MSQRLRKIRDTILEVFSECRPDDVAAEQFNVGPRKRSRVAQTFYLHGVVGLHLVEHGFREPLMIAPPTLKKWWGAKGADKEGVRTGLEAFLEMELPQMTSLLKLCREAQSRWIADTLAIKIRPKTAVKRGRERNA